MSESPQNAVTSEQLQKIREAFESVLECPLERRHAFIRESSGGDSTIIGAVEGMLDAREQRDVRLDPTLPSSEMGVCPSCKSKIAKSDRFCPACGTPAAGS